MEFSWWLVVTVSVLGPNLRFLVDAWLLARRGHLRLVHTSLLLRGGARTPLLPLEPEPWLSGCEGHVVGPAIFAASRGFQSQFRTA